MSERATERDEWTDAELVEYAADHLQRYTGFPASYYGAGHDENAKRRGQKKLDELAARANGLRDLARRLRSASTDAPTEKPSEVEKLLIGWEHAYPESIFPPPPEQPRKGAKLVWVAPEDEPGAIRELSEPFTIDSVSAAMGRSMAKALRRAFDADRAPTDEAPERERLMEEGLDAATDYIEFLERKIADLTEAAFGERRFDGIPNVWGRLLGRVRPEPDREGERLTHRIECSECDAHVVFYVDEPSLDLSAMETGWRFNTEEGWTCPEHGSWPGRSDATAHHERGSEDG